jgi:hypothetical protein
MTHMGTVVGSPMYIVHAIRAWRVMPRAAFIILDVMLMG